ncbi:hypothetical protein EDF62_0609 [Leucobacter luti]|uniref:Uncharacterized protein n=1 Tax=Leucobacter luti TaxID=340320 RepID=A0A4R6S922_9MICO|nr:hypothetical protein [Leucobacter luti]TDP95914.1 hypothetical protein EDF62_0609 [Leucobacter luti]
MKNSSSEEPPTEIRLANDYMAFRPLWGEYGGLHDDNFVPADIDAQLKKWADTFEDYYDVESGWQNIEICQRQYAEGQRLAKVVQEHFGTGAVVSLDFWELRVSGKTLTLKDLEF